MAVVELTQFLDPLVDEVLDHIEQTLILALQLLQFTNCITLGEHSLKGVSHEVIECTVIDHSFCCVSGQTFRFHQVFYAVTSCFCLGNLSAYRQFHALIAQLLHQELSQFLCLFRGSLLDVVVQFVSEGIHNQTLAVVTCIQVKVDIASFGNVHTIGSSLDLTVDVLIEIAILGFVGLKHMDSIAGEVAGNEVDVCHLGLLLLAPLFDLAVEYDLLVLCAVRSGILASCCIFCNSCGLGIRLVSLSLGLAELLTQTIGNVSLLLGKSRRQGVLTQHCLSAVAVVAVGVCLHDASCVYIGFNFAQFHQMLGQSVRSIGVDDALQIGNSLIHQSLCLTAVGHIPGIHSTILGLQHQMPILQRSNALNAYGVAVLVDGLTIRRNLVVALRAVFFCGNEFTLGNLFRILCADAVGLGNSSEVYIPVEVADVITTLTHRGLGVVDDVVEDTLHSLIALDGLDGLLLCIRQLLTVVLRHNGLGSSFSFLCGEALALQTLCDVSLVGRCIGLIVCALDCVVELTYLKCRLLIVHLANLIRDGLLHIRRGCTCNIIGKLFQRIHRAFRFHDVLAGLVRLVDIFDYSLECRLGACVNSTGNKATYHIEGHIISHHQPGLLLRLFQGYAIRHKLIYDVVEVALVLHNQLVSEVIQECGNTFLKTFRSTLLGNVL